MNSGHQGSLVLLSPPGKRDLRERSGLRCCAVVSDGPGHPSLPVPSGTSSPRSAGQRRAVASSASGSSPKRLGDFGLPFPLPGLDSLGSRMAEGSPTTTYCTVTEVNIGVTHSLFLRASQ